MNAHPSLNICWLRPCLSVHGINCVHVLAYDEASTLHSRLLINHTIWEIDIILASFEVVSFLSKADHTRGNFCHWQQGSLIVRVSCA